MVQLASEIVLSEPDAELTLLGSVFMSPEVLPAVAEDVRPEWFSDPFARYLYEAAIKLSSAGHRLSPPAVVALLPEQCGTMSRGAFFAHACAKAVPASMVGGLVHTVRDRWARRAIVAQADVMRQRAVLFGEEPLDIAADTIMGLDEINVERGRRKAGPLDSGLQSLIASFDAPQRLRGATTGLAALDSKLNGYMRGQLYVIAGRPGMGKSAFMCSSLRRTAQMGYGVAVFSLEMSEEEIAARCLADTLDNLRAPGFGDILKGLFSDVDRAEIEVARDSLAGLPMMIDASARLTCSEIAGRARKAKAILESQGRRLDVLCIDHMGLVTPSDRYAGNRVAEAGEVSGFARALAKELDCCVVLLCQLSRDVEKREDKRPMMSDLRWSGEIEQDAHVVGFLYREAYYLALDPEADPVRIHEARFRLDFLVRKNRNGPTDDVRLWCSIAHSSIRDD